mmetsp:Transcript_46658/g.110960  ORF Transcript_46658/g.110960 Transcript_46658/m.110960 type:complete len:281 (+) Transcript_46658:102-944(+)
MSGSLREGATADRREEQPLGASEVRLLLQGLTEERTCAAALMRLARHRKDIPEFPHWIRSTPGALESLLRCVEDAHANMQDPSTWTRESTNRTSGALAIFQVLVSHPTMRNELQTQLPQRLLPLLTVKQQDVRSSAVQTTALGVVAAMLKAGGASRLPPHILAQVKTKCEEIAHQGQAHSRPVTTYILRKLGKKADVKPPAAQATPKGTAKVKGGCHKGISFNNILVKELKEYEPKDHVVWGDFERIDDDSATDSEFEGRILRGTQPIYRVEMSSDGESD